MDRQTGCSAPFDHFPVRRGWLASAVDGQDQRPQGYPLLKIALNGFLPVLLKARGDFCVTVTGQVYEAKMCVEGEENNLLGPAGGLAGTGQRLARGDSVDGAGLADIGSSGKRNLGAGILHPVATVVCGAVILSLSEQLWFAGR